MNPKQAELIKHIFDCKSHFIRFLRQPWTEITHLPDWDWKKLILFLYSISALTGAIGGLTEKKIIGSVFVGIFISPIVIFIMVSIGTLIFYYSLQLFFRQTASWRKIFTLLVFANIPLILFRVVSSFFPAINLFGLVIAGILLVVGLNHHFQIETKKAIRLIGSLFICLIITWIYFQFKGTSKFDRNWKSEKVEAPEVHLGK